MMNKQSELVFPHPKMIVFQVALKAISEHPKMKIKNYDEAQGFINASVGISALSWGEKVIVNIKQLEPNSTSLSINSGSHYALVDWGKNRKNTEELVRLITGGLPATPTGVITDETNTRQCANCGNSLLDDAKFCVQCGKAQPASEPQSHFCRSCGSKIEQDNPFCASCGAKQ
ncbi:zinc ribbon domain-containing protein [Christensenellaceae bacterium OttesenSCG-928-K19]|nr:zinc ribbon domain-containing protein [Christensenellaceae bacterium OttesenSCG-928-K19]